jgi:hypothetical protein
MKKAKIAALCLMAGGFVMALGLNCLPNIGGTLDLSGLTGGLLG